MAERDASPPQMRPRLAAWIVAGGAILAVGVFLQARSTQDDRAGARFEAAVVEAEGRLLQRLRVCEDLLRGVRGLVQADGEVTRARFRAYLDAMDLGRRHPGLLGVSYGVPVGPGGLDAIRTRLEAEHGLPAPLFHPMTGTPDDAIVLFAEPEVVNSAALGFNSASSPEQRGSLVEARDSGEVRASPPLTTAQAPGAGLGLVMRLAIYGDPAAATVEARRRAFKGYVNGVFLLADLVRDASTRLSLDGIRVAMVDVTDPEAPRPFLQGGRAFPVRWWHVFAPRGLARTVVLPVSGRRWSLGFDAGPSFYHADEAGLPWVMGLTALLMSLLVAALVRSVTLTGQRARRLADRMTRELRRSESRLRAITQVLPDLVLVLDDLGRYIEVHAGDPSLLTAPAESLVGQTIRSRLPGPVADVAMATIAKALAEDRVQSVEYAVDIASGPAHFEARVAPMGEPVDGRPCVVWVARDVTSRRAQEEGYRQAQKLEGLGLLAGGIAHDFNNLLAAIQGYLSLGRLAVADGKDPSTYLASMDISIRRAADLARELLAYSGRTGFHVEPIDLNALVEEMSGLLGVSRTRKVALDVRLAPGLPGVRGDRAQLQQVVMNLVTNACEAIPSEAGQVELVTAACDLRAADIARRLPAQGLEPGPYVELVVRDNGCGMTPDVLARIFDPFFTTKPAGRGLGLSAIRGILRAHGAGVEIQSQPGEGTTFRVYFPAHAPVAAAAPSGLTTPVGVRPVAGAVLVADDEPLLRDTQRMMVERLGMRVVEASDGEEAWAAFRARPQDLRLLVLDLTMPRLGGAEVYRRIRAEVPRFPVILCSGYSREELPDLGDPNEPTVFLQKPFAFKQFEAAVREVLGRA